jgi:hypothetical protein
MTNAMTSPANKPQPALAMHPTITTPGMKGFLQWAESDPVVSKLIPRIAPQIRQLNSSALGALRGTYSEDMFLGHGFSGTYSEDMFGARSGLYGLGYLGDDSDGTDDSGLPNISVTDLDSTVGAPSLSSSISVPTFSADTSSSGSVSASASTAPASASWAAGITSLIAGVGAGLVTADQLNNTNKIVSAQLAQAQAGKPPLNLASYGLTSGGLTGSTGLILLLGLGALAFLALSGKKSAA